MRVRAVRRFFDGLPVKIHRGFVVPFVKSVVALESQNFRDLKPEFDKAGAVILGCSGDTVEAQAKFHAKEHLNFPLLSDTQFDAIEAYDARRMKSFLGKTFLGIVRSTFLIDADGRIAKIWDKVKVKDHAAEVLEAVKKL